MSAAGSDRGGTEGGPPSSRWAREAQGRSTTYDTYWEELAREGKNIHGEVDCLQRLCPVPAAVLDAGCGTGRVAVELVRRGYDVVGVDLDDSMLVRAREKDPTIDWVTADLATMDLGRTFDLVAMAGNVMIFLEPGTEARVVANLASHLRPGGLLVAGFQLEAGRLGLDGYDAACTAAGLELAGRQATWEGEPYSGGDYAVSVHRLRA